MSYVLRNTTINALGANKEACFARQRRTADTIGINCKMARLDVIFGTPLGTNFVMVHTSIHHCRCHEIQPSPARGINLTIEMKSLEQVRNKADRQFDSGSALAAPAENEVRCAKILMSSLYLIEEGLRSTDQ